MPITDGKLLDGNSLLAIKAYLNTYYAPLASPTFTGTVGLPVQVRIGSFTSAGFVKYNNGTLSIDETSQYVSDVKVNNTSIVNSGIANLVTNTAYSASTNKIATMSDIDAARINLENGTGTNSVKQKTASGSENIASGTNSFAIGMLNTASNIESMAQGYGTTAAGNYSHSEGFYNVSWADISHTEGQGNVVGDLTEGDVPGRITGQVGHAEGFGNLVLGYAAHAEGYYNLAKGDYSHVEGIGANDWANPENSELAITEFDETKYIQANSSANTFYSGGGLTFILSSFNAGTQTYADFRDRLQAGDILKVIHSPSNTVEEYEVNDIISNSIRVKDPNASLKWQTGDTSIKVELKINAQDIASGTALGIASHVSGYHNYAAQNYQTVVGKFNLNKTNTLFEVGNGSDNTHRSNAFEVYSNGSVLISDVYNTQKSNIVARFRYSSAHGIEHGSKIISEGYFIAYGDDDGYNTLKPTDNTSFQDPDAYYFNTGITVHDSSGADDYKLSFPDQSGTFALTSDIGITAAADDILDATVTNKVLTYAPYSATTANSTWVGTNSNAGKLYLGTVNPSKDTRLNYNGYLYATRLYDDGKRVITSHQDIKQLDTTATTAQTPVADEDIIGTGKITLHKVAKTGTYSDLIGTPSISNATITIHQSGQSDQTFTLNGSATTINLTDFNTTYTIATGDANGQIKVTPSVGNAYNVSVAGLGAAAYKGVTTAVTSGSADLVTSGAVYTAIDNLPEPMVFKGGATITKSGSTYTISVTAPASASDIKEGYTYKITSAPSGDANFKVGDTIIANQNNPGTNPQSNWTLIPSGDEPSGTVTSVGLSMPTGFTVTGSPVETSGTLTATFASGYELLNSNSAQTIAGTKIFSDANTYIKTLNIYTNASGGSPSSPTGNISIDGNSGKLTVAGPDGGSVYITSNSNSSGSNITVISTSTGPGIRFTEAKVIEPEAGVYETVKANYILPTSTKGSTASTIPEFTLATTADIPSVSLTTTTGSEAITVGSDTLSIVTRDTTQTITGKKTFEKYHPASGGSSAYYSGMIVDGGEITIKDNPGAHSGSFDYPNVCLTIEGASNPDILKVKTTSASNSHWMGFSKSDGDDVYLSYYNGTNTLLFSAPSSSGQLALKSEIRDNYYAQTDYSSGNDRTKIATGYANGTASTTYDLYVPNGTESQAGILQLGTTATTAAKGNHTHTTTLTTDTGTSTVTLAYGGKYKLTTGGTSVIFTMPASDNTNYYHTPSYNSGLKIATGTGVNDLYVPEASYTQAGVVKVGDQTFKGTKTIQVANGTPLNLTYNNNDTQTFLIVNDSHTNGVVWFNLPAMTSSESRTYTLPSKGGTLALYDCYTQAEAAYILENGTTQPTS